jgi:biotin carboxylase/SAM-dependent methyltransferase
MAMNSVIFVNLRPYQLEANAALLAARRAGMRVALLADKVPRGIVTSLIDDVELVDTFDLPIARRAAGMLALRAGACGVVTWSDRDVELVSLIAQDLGLPGLGTRAAHLVRNKHAGRLALAGYPGLVPDFQLVDSAESFELAIARIGFPAVLKPLTGSGSKGIFEVVDKASAHRAWEKLREYTQESGDPMFAGTEGQWLYEERLNGTEHSVEGLVQAGYVYVVAVTDKVTAAPYHLEVEHIQPSALDSTKLAAVDELTRTVVKAFGLDNCAFHLECKVDSEGRARLVEVAGRAAGGMIASHLVPLATGIDFCRDVIRVAAAIPIAPVKPTLATAAVFAGARSVFAERGGTIEGVNGLSDALAVPGVEYVAMLLGRGDRTKIPPEDFMSQRVATIIGRAGDREELRANLTGACALVSVQLKDDQVPEDAEQKGRSRIDEDLGEVANGWDRLQRVASMDEARAAVLGTGFVGQFSNVTPHYVSTLAKRLGLDARSRVLDAGSGTGGLSIALAAQTGCDVVGIDVSPRAVEVANERIARHPNPPNVSFVTGDLGNPPPDLGQFDAVFSFGSSYWSAPDIAVPRWRRLLRADTGTVVLLLTRIYADQPARNQRVGLQPGLFLPHADWEEALAKAGFSVSTADLTDLDGLYFRSYLDNLRRREAALRAEMGNDAGSRYIAMFEQFLSYYDQDLLRRVEIIAKLSDDK